MTDIPPIPAGLAPMPERLRRVAEAAKGFMPPGEGLALYATYKPAEPVAPKSSPVAAQVPAE